MAVTLTTNFIAELKKGVNAPNTIIELSGVSNIYSAAWGMGSWGMFNWGDDVSTALKLGLSDGGFTDVLPVLKTVSSLQNKIDIEKSFSNRGECKFVITGRDNFKNLIRDNYLKNRRVVRKDGFIASGFAYSDYATTYTGMVKDWSRKGDELTITVTDDLAEAEKDIPEENETNTQYIDYRNMNPVDIIKDILQTQLDIDPSGTSGLIDTTQFDAERDRWYNGWKFSRVITEPKEANEYLNELQQEINGFVFHDGGKINFKAFAPPIIGETTEEWQDGKKGTEFPVILENSLECSSGYDGGFYNRIVVYYDNDSEGDGDENFESVLIVADAASQDATQWDEISTKEIRSKWMRSRTWTGPINCTGVFIYHVSRSNPAGFKAGDGFLRYSFDGTNQTLSWRSTDGSGWGEVVTVNKSGQYQLFAADGAQNIRVIVDYNRLPAVEKISNGNFEAGDLTDWLNYVAPAKAATFTASQTSPFAGLYSQRIDITTGGTDVTDIIAYHTGVDGAGLSTRTGHPYKLKFMAKADSARTISVALVKRGTIPLEHYSSEGSQSVSITTAWAAYEVTFTGTLARDNGAIVFLLGNSNIGLNIDNVSFAEYVPDGTIDPSWHDAITVTEINADLYAQILANMYLRRYKDPVASVKFDVDMNALSYNNKLRTVTDLIDLTTDEAFEKGDDSWTKERVMLTSLRPDFEKHKVRVEAIETKIYTNKYGFIGASSITADWDSAAAAQKLYAFIGDSNNQLGAANDEGFKIW
ncbi:MAG: carbohydrate binding domain-containing protein [Deltaproteobacteria bacterium]|nr:carbohydrate binding domain-containing protein [Deltaproteobacteria bacterium]